MKLICQFCHSEFQGRPHQKFCSVKCGAMNRSAEMRGPRLNESRSKGCEYCGKIFTVDDCQHNLAKFRARRFCCTRCSALACRPHGSDHPMWKSDLEEKQRTSRGPQQSWAYRVKTRDNWTCQQCGAQGGRLEAHHIDEFAKNKELRWDVENGITLCWECHKRLHAQERETRKNAVNSVKPCGNVRPTDNTEPSLSGNALEGVTTRNRAYGLWHGECGECGKLFYRQMFRVRGKAVVYCCNSCAATARMRQRYGSNCSHECRAPKGEEIV